MSIHSSKPKLPSFFKNTSAIRGYDISYTYDVYLAGYRDGVRVRGQEAVESAELQFPGRRKYRDKRIDVC